MKYLWALVALCCLTSAATADEYQLLRFRADWCSPCVRLKNVFDNNNLAATLKQHRVKDVYIDVDKNPNAVKAWGVKTVPCTILVLVDNKNRAKTIRRNGGNKRNPAKHMDAPTYRTFVKPK